jgi:hypothetical protein
MCDYFEAGRRDRFAPAMPPQNQYPMTLPSPLAQTTANNNGDRFFTGPVNCLLQGLLEIVRYKMEAEIQCLVGRLRW